MRMGDNLVVLHFDQRGAPDFFDKSVKIHDSLSRLASRPVNQSGHNSSVFPKVPSSTLPLRPVLLG